MIEVVVATEEHARSIGERMRPEDLREVEALGLDGPGGVLYSLRYSAVARTGLADGVPFSMWGACTEMLIGASSALIWCLAANGAEKHAKHQLRISRAFVRDLLVIYPQLYCYVDPTYTKTHRWVEWLGAKHRGDVEFGGKPFMRYEWSQ